MTSLVRDSIATMTGPRSESADGSTLTSDPNLSIESTTSTPTSSTTSINSIPILKSVQDWWSSPRSLMYESKEEESDQIKQDRLRNRNIEYELFRTLLPSDIHIYPPQEYDNDDKHDDKDDDDVNEEYLITGKLIDVKLDDGNFIHEFYLENKTTTLKEQEQHIVVIHGYMAAMGYFIKNIEDLIRIPGIKLHLIDLPGFGNSSRPKFPKEFIIEPFDSLSEKINQILQIENWFIDKIENWRINRNINQFKLIGHSMGAYLACCYLMKYNNNNKLLVSDVILVSPMGTESNEFSLINDKRFQFNLYNDPFKELQFNNNNNNNDNNDIIINEELTNIWTKLGKPKFPKNWLLKKLWLKNKSPFEFLQNFGPFYSKILSYWSFQRFKNFEIDTNKDTIELILKLHNYSYSIFNQFQGSGEIAITKLITPEILAKLPLADRGLIDFFVDNKINNMWIYGDNDWMNKNGGEYIYQQINDKIKNQNGDHNNDNDKISRFEIVEKAGHHIYLDNPKIFNQLVIDFFKLV